MLDEHHLLVGHFLQLQDRLEMAEEGLRFLHLGRVNDEELVAEYPSNRAWNRPASTSRCSSVNTGFPSDSSGKYRVKR
jgi:hypothetical protein